MQYYFNVTGDRLTLSGEGSGNSGNTNTYEGNFEFTGNDWNSYAKVAVFLGAKEFITPIIEGRCTFPNEILAEPNHFYIGVYGVYDSDETKKISTNLIPFTVNDGAFRPDTIPPTPDIWEHYLTAVSNYTERAENAAGSAEESASSAERSKTAAESAAATAGERLADTLDAADRAESFKNTAEAASREAVRARNQVANDAASAAGSARQADAAKSAAELNAGDASASKNAARQAENNASVAAERAEISERNAEQSAVSAQGSAEVATEKASQSATNAESAAESAETASESQTAAAESSRRAEAAKVAIEGSLAEHNTDSTAHEDIREDISEINGKFCISNTEPEGNELIWIKPPGLVVSGNDTIIVDPWGDDDAAETGDPNSHIYYRSSSNSEWVEVAGIEDIPDVSGFATSADLAIVSQNKISVSEKGTAGGVAELDANGYVPSSQLPSYVDDVIEGTLATFPRPGESGKIYVDTNTRLAYRWSGSDYVEISPSIALGETASTAYAGNKGKQNADNIAAQGSRISALESGKADGADLTAHTADTNNPHGVTKAQIGLSDVDNTSDADKPISTATQNKFRSLEHYGDANIVPSTQSLFWFAVDNVNHTATVSAMASGTIQGNIVIPYEYTSGDNTYTVTAIRGFQGGQAVSFIIPDTVTSIGNSTFANNKNLVNVTIPDSVTSIGEGAFSGCDHLTDVYYGGSIEDWQKISIGAQNEQLYNATIHYAKTKQIYPITFGDWVNGKFVVNPNGEGNYIMGCTPAGVKYVRQISTVPILKEVYGFSPDIAQSVVDTSTDFYTDAQLKIYKASVVGLDSRIYTTAYDNDKETPFGQNGASTGLREGRYIVHPRGTKTVIAFGSELVAYGGHVKVSFELGCHRAWQTGTIGYTADGTEKSDMLQSNENLWRYYEFSVSSDAGTLGTLSGDSAYNGMSGIVINYLTATDGTEYFWIRNLKVEPEGFGVEI